MKPVNLFQYLKKHKKIYTNINTVRTWNAFGDQILKVNKSLTSAITLAQYMAVRKALIDAGYKLNSIKTFTDKLKALMRAAGRDGYKVSPDIHLMTTQAEDSHAIYLSMTEIRKIANLKLLDETLEIIRDRFIIGCLTGLRISDYMRFNMQHVIGNNIEITTTKTGTRVVIPIHPILRKILNKYNKKEVAPPCNWYFNKMLPLIGAKAHINDIVVIESSYKGALVQETFLKHELISSHTARRSAATNMYLAGIPTFRIMLITGHKTEAAFFKYIRVSKQDNATELSKHPFFS